MEQRVYRTRELQLVHDAQGQDFVGQEPRQAAEAEGGRVAILLGAETRIVHPAPKRAHQGWRYLTDRMAPRDLAEGEDIGDIIPGKIAGKLAKLGLI